ncbi:GTP-binding protein [Virgisporangium ochraceum]|uniref:Isoniazid inducible gene protein IniA n=1 Tax=Virgisporangium ochraceum TaxID=65505 RepID=A0A8J3ZWC4_9ACTN|nr:GTP-binding protein [Virgisporangium ochraceum]GIJ70831.1 isoniazid inducible gene protein IniA [Virgisporangium ochraceum]
MRPASPRRHDGAETETRAAVDAPHAPDPSVAPSAPRWLDLLDETTRVCAAYGRADLVGRLGQRRAQLLDPQLRVLVLGAPKQGKSQLINALLNAPVCPVSDGDSGVLTTVVQHAAAPSACLVRRASEPGRSEVRTPVPFDRLVARPGGPEPAPGSYAEIGVPRSLLAAGIALAEVPAAVIEAPDGSTVETTVADLAAYVRADTAILVSAATAELTRGELALLSTLVTGFPEVVVALTKTDLAVGWRRVLHRNRQALADAGIPARVVPVSSALRLRAATTGDRQLNAESGFPHLVSTLLDAVSHKGDRFARSAVTLVGRSAVRDLATALNQELAGIASGGDTDAMSRLREAQRRSDELRRSTVRWQNALADEVADLLSDVEYELRESARVILRRVDGMLDEIDPVRGWSDVEDWLNGAMVDTAEEACASLVDRIDALAERVARQLTDDPAAVVWKAERLHRLTDRVSPIDRPVTERFTLSQRVFSGLRGSYGGVLMFGLATSLAGQPLINPISLGAGAVFGGKSIFDDGRSVRKRRQAAAKAAVQRHIDDVFLRLGKDVRDAIRHVQRTLRDQLATLTDGLQESIVEFARTAKQAADSEAAVREHRAQRIRRELMRLESLDEQARELS